MRKKVWMALAGCVILGLSGCGSTASDTAQEVQDSASEDTEEEASEKASWYGTRVVTETKAAEVSALSEEEISGKVGNTVTYEANTVQINEEQLEIEGYETMQDVYTPDSIKEDYKADLSDWEDGVENISFGEVISSEDQEFFGDTFFVTDTGDYGSIRKVSFSAPKRKNREKGNCRFEELYRNLYTEFSDIRTPYGGNCRISGKTRLF